MAKRLVLNFYTIFALLKFILLNFYFYSVTHKIFVNNFNFILKFKLYNFLFLIKFFIYLIGGNTVMRSVKRAHDGPVFSILVQKDGMIITGGKDGRIIEWDRDLQRKGHQMVVPEIYGAPRVVTTGKGSRLVVGTTRNSILGGTFALPLQPIMQVC